MMMKFKLQKKKKEKNKNKITSEPVRQSGKIEEIHTGLDIGYCHYYNCQHWGHTMLKSTIKLTKIKKINFFLSIWTALIGGIILHIEAKKIKKSKIKPKKNERNKF